MQKAFLAHVKQNPFSQKLKGFFIFTGIQKNKEQTF
jgi:hypothetical protein